MRKHVLVVDDEWDLPHEFGQLRKSFEGNSSFQLTGCASCEEALERLNERNWFAVVLDLVFPAVGAMQGADFLRKVVGSHPRLPVIVLTNHRSLDLTVQLMREGAVGYVLKDAGTKPGTSATQLLLTELLRIEEGNSLPRRILRLYGRASAGLRSKKLDLLSLSSTDLAKRGGKRKKKGIPAKEAIMPGVAAIHSEVFNVAQHIGQTSFSREFALSVPEFFLSRLYDVSGIGNFVEPEALPSGEDIAAGLSRYSDRVDKNEPRWPESIPVVVCHALNAAPDSIALIADLGRGFRISRLLATPPRRVFLAGPNWACLNTGNRTAFEDQAQLQQQIRRNLANRLHLYERLQWDVALFDIEGEIAQQPDGQVLDMSRISAEMSAARDLLIETCGEFPVVADDRKQLQQQLREALSPGAAKATSETKALLETIYACADISRGPDDTVLTYFLAQDQATSAMGDCFLKAAVESEQAFDRGIRRRTEVLARDGPLLMGLYFPQYRVGELSVLPYSTVSSDALAALGEGVALRELLERLILVGMAPDNDAVERATDCLSRTPEFHRARLLADCLSFLHNLCYVGFLAEQDACGALSEVSPQLAFSFDFYVSGDLASQNNSPFRKRAKYWLDSIDTPIFECYPLPYHLIPFLWYEDEWDQSMREIARFLVWLSTLTGASTLN